MQGDRKIVIVWKRILENGSFLLPSNEAQFFVDGSNVTVS